MLWWLDPFLPKAEVWGSNSHCNTSETFLAYFSGLFAQFSTGFGLKTGGPIGLFRFACMPDLLHGPDRQRLRFLV